MAKKSKKNLHVLLEVVGEEDDGPQEFDQKSVIIGSGPTANLLLEDDSVSTMHAILQAGEQDDEAVLVDLGSEEGIELNGDEVEREAVVRRGDTLTIGEVEVFVVGVGPDAVATKAERPPAAAEAIDEEDIEEEDIEAAEEFAGEPTRPDAKPARAAAAEAQESAKPAKKPPKPPPKRKKKPAPASGTQVVRQRDIPRQQELEGPASGQNFFERELNDEEKPRQDDRCLEVKVMWGPIVLDARLFGENDTVTVGEDPKASFQLGLDRLPGETFTLCSPGGTDGHVVHVASGMELDVRRQGKSREVGELPSQGAVRTYALRLGDRARVLVGQLAFVIQYTSGARGVRSTAAYRRDFQMGKWWWTFFIIAVGMWFAIDLTPKPGRSGLDYLKNPARFAALIMPTQKQEKKSFEEIKKKKEEEAKKDEDAKWKKVTKKSKKNDASVPREVKRERDRKVATNAGILGLLKKKGGGTGDNASSVFGGAASTDLDNALESLNRSGMGDSGGFGGLGTRGGGPGGGSGLGLGGMGTSGYGRGGGAGTGSVKIGHRGKARVKVRKGRTRIVGGLSQKVVGRYIKRYWAQFKFCYERELSKNPNLYGKVTCTFTITGNGRVSEASVLQSSMHNTNVEQCLLRTIRRIRFPTPKGGGEVIVTYPFMFTTAG